MGATFAIPILEGVAPADLATREGLVIAAAVAHGGTAPWEVDLSGSVVLALGGERHGLAGALATLEERFPVLRLTIPQRSGTDSLNVSAAGAALLAEIARQQVM
jgi:tRNA G18 (ribose-2'-O)-methylase SpoU